MAGQKTKRRSKSGRKKIKAKSVGSERADEDPNAIFEEQGSDGSGVSPPSEEEAAAEEASAGIKETDAVPTPTNSPANTPITSPAKAAAATDSTTSHSPAKTPEKTAGNTPVNSPSKSPFRNLLENLGWSPAKTPNSNASEQEVGGLEQTEGKELPMDDGEGANADEMPAVENAKSPAPKSPLRIPGAAEDPETPTFPSNAGQTNPSNSQQSPCKSSTPAMDSASEIQNQACEAAPAPAAIATTPGKASVDGVPGSTEPRTRDTTIKLEGSRKCGCIIC